MIRIPQKNEINQIAAIWLHTNLQAHSFIPGQYWQEHFESVKELLAQAELYVYEAEPPHQIQGFIGLDGSYIAGIFVRSDAQSQGIGKQLLRFVKDRKDRLQLHVYQKNIRAVKFYQREGFSILEEGIDENTGEKEYFMEWRIPAIE